MGKSENEPFPYNKTEYGVEHGKAHRRTISARGNLWGAEQSIWWVIGRNPHLAHRRVEDWKVSE